MVLYMALLWRNLILVKNKNYFGLSCELFSYLTTETYFKMQVWFSLLRHHQTLIGLLIEEHSTAKLEGKALGFILSKTVVHTWER